MDVTFLATPVLRLIEPKTMLEKPPMPLNPASASIDANVWAVSNWRCVSTTFNVTVLGMWTVLPPPVRQRQTHCCYIQRALSPKEIQDQEKARKRKRQRRWGPPAKRGAAAGLQTLQANEDDLDPEDEDDEEETPPPLRVFFDIEAM